MSTAVHMAITRRVRPGRVAEFEVSLQEFAIASLSFPGVRGVHLLYPTPPSSSPSGASSPSPEYGVLRTFASQEDCDAFYRSDFYNQWLLKVAPMVEGGPDCRELDGLEVWFRDPHGPMPPRWKMALLTWLAVWPVSMAAGALVLPIVKPAVHPILAGGIIAGCIVLVLTWVAMPLMVRLAHPWLRPGERHPRHRTPPHPSPAPPVSSAP